MSTPDETKAHIERVRALLVDFTLALADRAIAHDQSKLKEPERSAFERASIRLSQVAYGSPEYEAALKELGDTALKHHYQHNPHHPEHFDNGIDGMGLVDVVEMLCDWKAAGERHKGGSMAASLEHNRSRFDLSDQVYAIFQNTVRQLGWDK